jgi:hypothetical protein
LRNSITQRKVSLMALPLLKPLRAARYIVPVSRSAAEQVKALRHIASGKFISASTPGVYQYIVSISNSPFVLTKLPVHTKFNKSSPLAH